MRSTASQSKLPWSITDSAVTLVYSSMDNDIKCSANSKIVGGWRQVRGLSRGYRPRDGMKDACQH